MALESVSSSEVKGPKRQRRRETESAEKPRNDPILNNTSTSNVPNTRLKEQNTKKRKVTGDQPQRFLPESIVTDPASTKRNGKHLKAGGTIKVSSHRGNGEEDNKDVVSGERAPKAPSKRQLKRKKAEKRESQKREASRLAAIKRGLNYVSKWKHARNEWKFEKLRQVWLMENLLDDTAIPDNIFPTVLEYFEGCKGMAREQLLQKSMDIIKAIEDKEQERQNTEEENVEAAAIENRDNAVESSAYKRARQVLQVLPVEI